MPWKGSVDRRASKSASVNWHFFMPSTGHSTHLMVLDLSLSVGVSLERLGSGRGKGRVEKIRKQTKQ